jgi:hypothetical protein
VVCGPSDASPAERARWLAELAEALDEASVLTARVALSADNQLEVFDLYHRMEAARLEVQALRVSRSLNPRDENAPERTDLPRTGCAVPGGD